ncbi:FMN-dependent NADH-azoreductase [Fundidesulfovibrio magnetotacticus]|uniref:FMN-dependent NADH-azoreductase n=1 Tax=Fundidesulfovibrio magnetotacticus TaxID=2730080 RepID=A0A6V8LSV1_9BACT|nr:flavodoxin family protein [Fundidesulfovibrio magnetotacticus]GFK93398.1 FMN-dependent NADH-azoreductase [Fundidesulfovibrio magnetotacticus]
MSKTAVFVLGSPRRKGNTAALARAAMECLASRGVTPSEIDAPRLEFSHPGCIACHKCQKSPGYGCHVDDALARAVNSLPGFDALVLATPVYWFSHPAQVKAFIDRIFSLIKFAPDHSLISPLAGKPWALLATGGGIVEENLEVLDRQWAIPAKRIGSPYLSRLFPQCHYPPGGVVRDQAAMDKARAFGDDLADMILGS